MKILHISDFHIVSDKTLVHAEQFKKTLQGIGIDFPLSVSQAIDRKRLIDHLRKNENRTCDAIVFSGDATSLGDKSSMDEAMIFLREIQEICLKNDVKENCIAIPGNHDVLAYGIQTLISQLDSEMGYLGGFLLRFIKGGKIKDFKDALVEFLGKLEIADVDPNSRNYFRDVLRMQFMSAFDPYACFPIGDDVMMRTINGHCVNGDPLKMNIFPANTVPTHPLFVNVGMVVDEHLENIARSIDRLATTPKNPDVVNVAVSHHGMMALSSDTVAESGDGNFNLTTFLEHSISSQINGFKLGKILQSVGYDVHLHGHEHQKTVIRYDFDVEHFGSIYSAGVPAAYGSNDYPISFATIELPNPFCMSIKNFSFSREASAFKFTKSDVVFDKIKAPKSTELAKKEVSGFFYSDDGVGAYAEVSKDKFGTACDELLINAEDGVFIFGVNLESLRHKLVEMTVLPPLKEKTDRFKKGLDNRRINILLVIPKSDNASYEVYEDKTMTSDVGEIRDDWLQFFEDLAKNLGMTPEALQAKFDIRYTHTPLSHAGTCEFDTGSVTGARHPKFSKALIQTIRIASAYHNEVFMELDYRTDTGLLSYFAGSAWNLWYRAKDRQELFSD